jgi:hypothetical protein
MRKEGHYDIIYKDNDPALTYLECKKELFIESINLIEDDEDSFISRPDLG